MSKSYKVAKKTINMGEKKGQTLFSVRPYSYGTFTSVSFTISITT